MKAYDHEKVMNWGTDILRKLGVNRENASITSKILVAADLRNIFSHGLAGGTGIDDIILKIEQGGINPDFKDFIPDKNREKYPTIVHIDAQGGLGHVAAVKAVTLVKDVAREYGSAKVYVRNSSHFGAAGIYSEMIAEEKDLIGKVSCTSPAWAAPYEQNIQGKKQKRLGTNPIAWSIPFQDGIVTIDMATTQRAAGCALLAAKENSQGIRERKKIPSDYLIDEQGREIICPENVQKVRNGSLYLLGGKQFGYKGYGLSLLIELDSIIGGCSGGYILAGDKTEKGRVCLMFEACAVDGFESKESVITRLTENIHDVKRHGSKSLLLPGQREAEYVKKYVASGIPYSESQVRRLREIGIQFDILFEGFLKRK